jgi:hypothetical protein
MKFKGGSAHALAVIAGISFIPALAQDQSNHTKSGHRLERHSLKTPRPKAMKTRLGRHSHPWRMSTSATEPRF